MVSLLSFPGFMEMTAVLLYVVSMMMTTDFMWNIIILFSEELELQLSKILFPVLKDKEAVKVEQESSKNRSSMIAAARNGDEEAMENLTMEEMDTYSMISNRIVHEDILSIVDSYFMPYGIQCDQYSILGEIIEYHTVQNNITDEELVQMTVECNNIRFDICINRADLLGDPAVGRRFKGTIWLQGQLHFQNRGKYTY